MFVCVVSLSQCSSRDLLYVKCLCVLSRYPVQSRYPGSRDLLYVKCLCVLSRCPSPVEICYMLNVFVCFSLSQCSRDLLMLNVCVCCLVVPVQ